MSAFMRRRRRSKRRRSKKTVASSSSPRTRTFKSTRTRLKEIHIFNSYQHGERGDRFIDGFLFHSIRRRAILVVGRRHPLSLFYTLSSQRVFFVKSSLRSYSLLSKRWIFSRERSAKKEEEALVSLKKNSRVSLLSFFTLFFLLFCFFVLFFALFFSSCFFSLLFAALCQVSAPHHTRNKNLELFSLATHTTLSLFF